MRLSLNNSQMMRTGTLVIFAITCCAGRSPNPPFGGYGPFLAIRERAVIIGADIMLEFSFLTNRLDQRRVAAGTRGT